IQQAIFSASNGDTIVVAPGTYFEQINFVGKAVTVVSSDGPSVTTLAGFNAFTIVTFQQGEGNGSVLRGFTISAANGSGIMVSNASPIVENNIITNGTGCNGGVGLSLNFSAAIVRNNVISGNQGTCSGDGAGIKVQGSGAVQILNNTIASNQAINGNGAGIALIDAGSPVVSSNRIHNNSASGFGGGIYVTGNTTPVITNNVIQRNQAGTGGGLYLLVNIATVVNNTIANNSASIQQPSAAPQVFVDRSNLGV